MGRQIAASPFCYLLYGCLLLRLRSSRSAGFTLLLFALLPQYRFARQPDFIALDGQHLYQQLIAKFQFIAYVANALLGNFADVQQPVGTGENLDERAEISEAHNFAEIRFAYFGGCSNVS